MENIEILFYDELESTTKHIKKMGIVEEFTTVVAKKQTMGLGRLNREFESNEGGIYFSMVLKPNIPIKDFLTFSLVAGIGILNGIKENNEIDIKLKYPNDIILNGKKLGGILIEHRVNDNHYIIGVGININNEITKELLKIATTTRKEGFILKEYEILQSIIKNIILVYNEFITKGFKHFLEEYKANCVNINRSITTTYKNKKITGKVVGLKESGELIVIHKGVQIFITL